MRLRSKIISLTLGGLCALGCSDATDRSDEQLTGAAVNQYVAIVHKSYVDSLELVTALAVKIEAFLAAPSAATLVEAKQAWLASREIYGQTEAYRFSDGPIDDPDIGPEGQINAWPLDEAYIDYVRDDPTSGIINHATQYPDITEEKLTDLNERGGEANIATGFHAIEFLLWGQDFYADGPGRRSELDYLPGAPAPAQNTERRARYLRVVTELLVSDLKRMVEAWAPDQNNYAAEFRRLPVKEAFRRLLSGMARLSNGELAGQRLETPLENKDQEDEHSCFSDNTHRDIYTNALGVQNVYLGRFGAVDGTGLDDVLKKRDPALEQKLRAELEASVAAALAIPAPFDQAILGDDSAPGRTKVRATVKALQAQSQTLVEVGNKVFGVQVKTEGE